MPKQTPRSFPRRLAIWLLRACTMWLLLVGFGWIGWTIRSYFDPNQRDQPDKLSARPRPKAPHGKGTSGIAGPTSSSSWPQFEAALSLSSPELSESALVEWLKTANTEDCRYLADLILRHPSQQSMAASLRLIFVRWSQLDPLSALRYCRANGYIHSAAPAALQWSKFVIREWAKKDPEAALAEMHLSSKGQDLDELREFMAAAVHHPNVGNILDQLIAKIGGNEEPMNIISHTLTVTQHLAQEEATDLLLKLIPKATHLSNKRGIMAAYLSKTRPDGELPETMAAVSPEVRVQLIDSGLSDSQLERLLTVRERGNVPWPENQPSTAFFDNRKVFWEARQNPERAAQRLQEQLRHTHTDVEATVAQEIITQWTTPAHVRTYAPEADSAWAGSLPVGLARDAAVAQLIKFCLKSGDRDSATEWLPMIADPVVRETVQHTFSRP